MIVVLGRPASDEDGEPTMLCGRIAALAARTGASVEVLGGVTDDGDGDAALIALGRAGVGHAAVLRTPASAAPRLDAGDIELGLRYLAECRVLVIADTLDAAALSAAIDGARYHGAALVIATAADGAPAPTLPDDATVLTAPSVDDGAFAALVARYSVGLDAGQAPAAAWQAAITETGWQPQVESDELDVEPADL